MPIIGKKKEQTEDSVHVASCIVPKSGYHQQQKNRMNEENSAPENASLPKGTLGSGAQAVIAEKSTRRSFFTPRPQGLTPSLVVDLLRNYEQGEFYRICRIAENVLRYDTQVAICANRRLAMSASLDWEIFTEDGESESERNLADMQRAALTEFFNTLVVRSVRAQDAIAGVQALVRHIATAHAFGYAAAAITWTPSVSAKGTPSLRCSILTCPLSLFEARDRRLRIRIDGSWTGKPLDTKGWLVAHSNTEPLILPTLVAEMFKSAALSDWAATVEKFGTPFISAKTPAAYKSDEWIAAEEAVKHVGSGFAGVFGTDVELDIHSLAQGEAPHENLVDYLDRSISRLWLGGDLSTMSKNGDAVGSNAQMQSTDILRKQDRLFAEQVIDTQLVRPFLARVFGTNVKQRAYFRLDSDDDPEDVSSAVTRIKAAVELGLPVSKAFAYSELGIPQPAEWEETLGNETQEQPTPAAPAQNSSEFAEFGNASTTEENNEALAKAETTQLSELISRLHGIEEIPAEDEAAFRNAVSALDRDFPEIEQKILSRNDAAQAIADIIDRQLASA